MINAEQSLSNQVSISWLDKMAKSTLVSVLSQLTQAQLVLKEQGEPVDTFGTSGSDLKAEVNILDTQAYRHLLFGGTIAAGETYAEQLWETPNLTNVTQVFARNLNMLDAWHSRLQWLALPLRKFIHWRRRNAPTQAKKNIAAHYDLGNKLYENFLDETMLYSAAIFPSPESSLSEAQRHKLKTICEKLALSPSDHLLEIGTGWGALAIFAAQNYGCKVTTTTISEQQHAYVKQKIGEHNLGGQITLLKEDYRDLTGQYSKLVSIEMIEAVGEEYLPAFFQKCDGLLHPDGLMLLQSITIDDRRYEKYKNGVDFIQKHIFPGGFLPSLTVISQHLKDDSSLSIRDCHDIGLHYAKTMKHWFERFNHSRPTLRKFGFDDYFSRMWQYYLVYCEAGFLERTISTVQLTLSKPEWRDEIARV